MGLGCTSVLIDPRIRRSIGVRNCISNPIGGYQVGLFDHEAKSCLEDWATIIANLNSHLMLGPASPPFAGYFRKRCARLVPCRLDVRQLYSFIVTDELATVADIKIVSLHCNRLTRDHRTTRAVSGDLPAPLRLCCVAERQSFPAASKAVGMLALNQGKGERTRAKERNARRRQRQETSRDKVVIGHASRSIASQSESSARCRHRLSGQHIDYYLNRVHYSCCCYEQMHFSGTIRGPLAASRR